MFYDLDDFSDTQAAFMSAFYEATYEAMDVYGDSIARVWNDAVQLEVTCDASDHGVDLQDDELYLANIEAIEPRRGDGGAALNWLAALADEFSIAIKLHPDTKDTQIINQTALTQMYIHRDYEELDNGVFIRTPR